MLDETGRVRLTGHPLVDTVISIVNAALVQLIPIINLPHKRGQDKNRMKMIAIYFIYLDTCLYGV